MSKLSFLYKKNRYTYQTLAMEYVYVSIVPIGVSNLLALNIYIWLQFFIESLPHALV